MTDRAAALLTDVPELGILSRTGSVRVPELRNVTFTRRTQEIVDHPAFQRLRRIRQLGPTHFVYPGATHTRFEHSLGVFSCVQWYILNLLQTKSFADSVSATDILAVLAAGLLHDLGHYPFAHNLEALHLKGRDTPKHETVGGEIIEGKIESLRGEKTVAAILRDSWGVDPFRVSGLCTGEFDGTPSQMDQVLRSIISGAIDADKMDYLERDSIHMGVPYGRNYDRDRLLASLTLNRGETKIAVSAKGKVSAEIFIFGRYTMFSEAYWHHTVRSASAMVEASIAAFYSRNGIGSDEMRDVLLTHDDDAFLRWLFEDAPQGSGTRYVLNGMIGNQRKLYKRIATFSRIYREEEKRRAYEIIYQLDAASLYGLVDRLRSRLGMMLGRTLHPADLIIDTPPRDKDKLETVDVVYESASGRTDYSLHELSRIVAGVQDDFIMVVKKIRIFAEPSLARELNSTAGVETLILEEILNTAV